MRILITGCTGFVGSYLVEALLQAANADLFGVSRQAQWPADCQHLAGRVNLRACDLSDRAGLEAVLRDIQPDQVYHLAGYAHVGQSFHEADAAWAGNLAASRNLYESVIHWGGRPRIVHVSSGLVYGDADGQDALIDERCLLYPASPYAASKAAADLAAYQYTRVPRLNIIRVRPFNHIGPRQSALYAVAHFAQQIATIEQGRQQAVVETGDLSSCRDLTDVRDMVRAYVLLMERGEVGEVYNAGSGVAHSMQQVLDGLVALARVKVEVRQREKWLRASETAAIRADASKLRRSTGWEPQYSLEQTLGDILQFWREAVARKG